MKPHGAEKSPAGGPPGESIDRNDDPERTGPVSRQHSSTMIEVLAQIAGDSEKGSFTAGIVLWDDTCVVASPIVRYMKGWSRQKIRSYVGQRKWTVSVVHEVKRERP